MFVLGLYRAGSTLTGQRLANHSMVEGTRDLPDLGPAECAALGQQYLNTTRSERKTQRPMFIDQMPANWMYAGLVHLMLPNA